MAAWKRLVRFIPKGSSTPLIGEPVEATLDVGLASLEAKPIKVNVFSGSSILDAGSATGKIAEVDRVLAPLTTNEVGTIRCTGLNYAKHAEEAKMAKPPVPVLFLKPAEALTDPYPQPVIIPKITQESNTGDYESELCVVIGKTCKDVTEADAMDYVLGYTASNDISSRAAQFATSQWCFSKGFDYSCPIGPVVVSKDAVPDPSKFHMRGLKNGKVLQESGLDDLIFPVSKLVSFFSQGTTLKAGTIILTGTPHGIGHFWQPPEVLADEDEFHVEILPLIGTLVNKIKWE